MAMTVPATEKDRWFLGTLLRIVADGADTGGQLAVFEQQAGHGFSPPRHVHHREDSALLVLDGAITAVVGDERVEVGAGGFVWLPRDVPHTFRVDSERVRLLELLTPAGFEQFHLDSSDPAPLLELPPAAEPDIPRLLAAIGPYDAEIVGPPLGPDD
ncbi:MAG TPA: cupin domain-containing protein [Acidimicrobiales bacterium]|nr:cupin domain-containing protein [Acidimicrobiales bacterium]